MLSYDPSTDPRYADMVAAADRRISARNNALGLGASSAELRDRFASEYDIGSRLRADRLSLLGDLIGLGQYGTQGSVNARLGLGQDTANMLNAGAAAQAQLGMDRYSGLAQNVSGALGYPSQLQQTNDYINALKQIYGV